MIQPMVYAPEYIKNIAAVVAPDAKAYAMFRMYFPSDENEYPQLRDRTAELTAAVKGMAGNDNARVATFKGNEMFNTFDFDAVGAEFVATFRFIFA